MSLEIRPATERDDAALMALDQDTWSPSITPAPRHAADARFFGPGRPPPDTLVAEIDGAIAGYVTLGVVIPLDCNRHVLTLTGLAVRPDRHRRGIGRRLVGAAVALAKARGARRLRSRVLGTNEASLALHASCGFVVEGVLREEFQVEGRYVDDVLLARDLTAS